MRKTLFLLLFGCFVACERKEENCTVECRDTDLRVVVKGNKFSFTDVDTVVFRKYVIDNNFVTVLSAATLYPDSSAIVADQVCIGKITKGYDWEVYIPALNKTYRFSDITDEGKTSMITDCKVIASCYNGIRSYVMREGASISHVTGMNMGEVYID